MAIDISLEGQLENAFSERIILGIIGFIFFTATSVANVFSNLFLTASSSSPVMFGMLRSLAFGCMALMYLIFSNFLKKRDIFVRSAINKTLFFVMQLLLPLSVVFEKVFFTEIPLPFIIVAWAGWGCSNAFLACSWVDRQSNLEEPNISGINFWSFTLAGCLVVGVLSMTFPMNIFAMISMSAISFVILLRTPHYSSMVIDTCEDQWITSKSLYNKNGSYIMFVDGTLIGIVACFLILWLTEYGLAQSFMGVAFLVTALVFYALRKLNPALLSLEHSQLVFLPVLICGLLFMEFAESPWQILFTFVLFSILYLFDYTNSSILSLRGNLLSVSACYCFSKGKIFIILGQGVGWACGAFLSTETGSSVVPLFIIMLVAFICLYISIAAICPEKYPLIVSSNDPDGPIGIDEPDTTIVIQMPYKHKCSQTAASCGLTPREGEILFYLAKGRNAKYIADRLFVAERTVKTHMYHIYQKLGTHSQQELIDIVENIYSKDD